MGLSLKSAFVRKNKRFPFFRVYLQICRTPRFSFFICWDDKKGLRDAILPKSLALRRYLLTVSTVTVLTMSHINATSWAVRKGCFFDVRQIGLLSQTVYLCDLPLFGRSWTVSDFIFIPNVLHGAMTDIEVLWPFQYYQISCSFVYFYHLKIINALNFKLQVK